MDALDADFFKTTQTRIENIAVHFAELLSNAPQKVKEEIANAFDVVTNTLKNCQQGVGASLSSLADDIDSTLQKIDSFVSTSSMPVQRDVLYANIKQASKEADRLREFEADKPLPPFASPDFVFGA